MRFPSLIAITSIVFAICTLFLIEHFDVWTGLLSHPFWSEKANWTGIGIGAVTSLILHGIFQENKHRLLFTALFFAVTALGLYLFTSVSKETFAASYAEDLLAGKFWYFGFIGYVTALFGLFSFAVAALLTEKK